MICSLEMKEAMMCIIPEVLLNLSKISANKHVAIPTLEFLSSMEFFVRRYLPTSRSEDSMIMIVRSFVVLVLATFPRVYANFTSTQYMTVFAIINPYTDPFKYDHYKVSSPPRHCHMVLRMPETLTTRFR